MSLVRFEPWSFVDLLHRDIDRSARRALGGNADDNSVTDWVPAVDIFEQNDRFVVRADVPGVDPDAIEVNMDGGVLSLSGTREAEEQSNEGGVSRIERVTGRFYRRFTLPETADADNVTAKSSNGILEISIPKQPAVQARRITVETH
ncbi:MAG: Hsp20/alpha crystallin family protein [Gammaproteobacteria bacterium]|nr:Hsp20/alpha crystallin family protein [Gammaproteobacteria bacterium]